MKKLLQLLGERNISSILVEGGGTINFSLLQAGLIDKVYAFIAPKLLGGKASLTPVAGEGFDEPAEAVTLKNITMKTLDGDILLSGLIRK
jgi:diaminohydroxyphosphoribosylaminopyrimidine deaminase/5-amino-6-(5-phosphoribosylamino)uracil reductase